MSRLIDPIRRKLQHVALHLVASRIRRSPRTDLSNGLFELLAWGWGNRAYIVEREYLCEIIGRSRTATGSILECGSGLSTLVAGALIDGSETTLYALEHDPHWYGRIRDVVEKFNLRNVRPVYAPLQDFGTFWWYDVKEAALPRDISLVLCDGPPGSTKGGRYGLLPVMRGHLLPGAVILVDDCKRAEERDIVDQWIKEFDGSLTKMGGTRFPYAVVTILPGQG